MDEDTRHDTEEAGQSGADEAGTTAPLPSDPQSEDWYGGQPPSATEEAVAPKKTGIAVVVAVTALVASLVSLVVGAAAGFAAARLAGPAGSGWDGPAKVRVLPSKTEEPVAAVAAAALSSIVSVDVAGGGEGRGKEEKAPGDRLPKNHPGVPLAASGSGVALRRSPAGGTYILTNNHVVEDATSISVTDRRGKRHKAKLVGRDADTDIAVLEIQEQVPVIKTADSDKVDVGDLVVAIGSPFGLQHSVTSGVVSAIHRSLPQRLTMRQGSYPLVDVIQTDAAINPGNSGGALLDRDGRLIGINTAIYSNSGASDGVGFAVPVNAALRVADELVKSGKAKHPFLGILGQTVNEQLAKEADLPVSEGALVKDVTKGTAAEKAGLKTGDLIVKLDDKPIRSMDDLILAVRRSKVGQRVRLGLYREGKLTEVEMTVGVKPDDLK